MIAKKPAVITPARAHEKKHFLAQARQYYERLLIGKGDSADAVIKIRYYIRRAAPKYSLPDLKPGTHTSDEREKIEADINSQFEEVLGKFPAGQKAVFIREALDGYALLTSGHPCDVPKTIQQITFNINNAGTTLAALEPDVPETRKEEIEQEIAKYFEKAEALAGDTSTPYQGNDPDINPPPFFGPPGKIQGENGRLSPPRGRTAGR